MAVNRRNYEPTSGGFLLGFSQAVKWPLSTADIDFSSERVGC